MILAARRLPAALDDRLLTLFRAALGQGAPAVAAYRAWRASEPLEAADEVVYRCMPLLVATADQAGITDADTRRMRGIVKHVWLSNATRVRDLVQAETALREAGIRSLLIKGGALFARDQGYMARRMTGDYDLLVRRADAAHAIETLRRASFRSHGMRIELFTPSDFDRDIHAVAMSRAGLARAIDLHWRAVHWVEDEGLNEALFQTAEAASLLGHAVLIPGLTEHLAIAAMRPEPDDRKETLFRALEVVHVLQHGGAHVDWERLCALVERFGGSLFAAHLLHLVASETQGLVPGHVVDRLWRYGPPGGAAEIGVRQVPPATRSRWQRFRVAYGTALRAQYQAPYRSEGWRGLPRAARSALVASAEHLPLLGAPVLWHRWLQASAAAAVRQDAGAWFGQGFSIPEDAGRWTEHEVAVLDLPVEGAGGAVVDVELRLLPFLPPGRRGFRLAAYAGAGLLQHVVIRRTHAMPFRLRLRARVVGTRQRRIVVALRLHDAQRPSALGLSIDPRLLGVLLQSVWIDGALALNLRGDVP